MGLRRDMCLSKVTRLTTGPEVSGVRPVLVTFQEFKDKEDVLRKSGMLKGTNIHLTEDMSRRMRESRTELRRFMREMKKNNPNLICYLQYDKLFVDNKCYVWNDLQAKVVEHFPGEGDMSRPGSVLFDERALSSMSVYRGPLSPTKGKRHLLQQQQFVMGEGDEVEQDKIRLTTHTCRFLTLHNTRELEETVRMLKEKLSACEDEHVEINGHKSSSSGQN